MESRSILQKGPKFAVSSSKVPITEYIAVTKRICDELGENTIGEGLYRNLPKNQRSPTNTSRKRRGRLATSPNKRRRPSKPSGKTPLE